MNKEQFNDWAVAAGLTPQQRLELAAVMAAAPVRTTQTGNAVRGYFPSRKMGRPIGFSSRTAEFPFCVKLEQDPNVVAYVEQPVLLTVTYATNGNAPGQHAHTPDYLALRKDVGPVFYECKHSPKLHASLVATPGLFVLKDGVWENPTAAAEVRERFGAEYRVAVAEDMSPVLTENLMFMRSHAIQACDSDERPDPVTVRRVTQRVAMHPGITAAQLKTDIHGLDLGLVWTLLNECVLHADFEAVPFTTPEAVKLFPTREALHLAMAADMTSAKDIVTALVDAGPDSCITIDAVRHSVVAVTATEIHLLRRGTEPVRMRLVDLHRLIASGTVRCLRTTDVAEATRTMIKTRTSADIAEAACRFASIATAVGARVPPPQGARVYCARQQRRFKARFREAERAHGFGLVGLLRRKPPGRPRVENPEVLAVFRRVIDEHYRTAVRCTALSVYPLFEARCREAGLRAFSLRTFYYQLGKLNRFETMQAREGHLAARKVQGPEYLWLSDATPVHGSYPWEIGHIDHTEIDLLVRCEVSGTVIKRRATLTLITLAMTRRVAGFHLGFEGETVRAVFAAMRNCVARNGRLPDILVMDNGAAFASADMTACCAALGVVKFARPPESGRAGSPLERMFGTINTELLWQLPGNTQATKVVKEMTPATDPGRRDDLPSLERTVALLGEYLFEAYDTRLHISLGNSPRAFEAHVIATQGETRPGRVIVDDEEFRFATSTTLKRPVTVQERYGVQVHYQHYMCKAFLEDGVAGTKVTVKRDDWDARVVYALVGGRWRTCTCKALSDRFQGLDPRALRAATTTLRAAMTAAKQAGPIKAEAVWEAIKCAEDTEKRLLWRATQRARVVAAEMHKLMSATPDVPSTAPTMVEEGPDDAAEPEETIPDPMRKTHVGRPWRRGNKTKE